MIAPIAVLFALLGVASAHLPYVFSDGYASVIGEPTESFTCDGRPYGYYADVANKCQVFHVCWPIEDDAGQVIQTAQFSFFCGNQTLFSQDSLTCSHAEDAFPCDQAESYYDIANAEFGKIPDQ